MTLRVLLTDIDIAMHMNNGMYFSVFDLGRFDLMVRSGVWRQMRARGWSPVAAGETISFRKSLRLGQRYSIETRIIGLDERAIYFEQRAVAGGEIYARAVIATRLVSRTGPVSNEEIVAAFGAPPALGSRRGIMSMPSAESTFFVSRKSARAEPTSGSCWP